MNVAMNVDQVNKLLTIGQLSLAMRAAELAAASAKREYHAAFRAFECDGEPDNFGPYENQICRGDPRWDEAMVHTKPEYDAYQTAKREAQKIKRRWQNAYKAASK